MDVRDVEQAEISTPPVQMGAVDMVMRHYFGAEDKLKQREKEFPGLFSYNRLVHGQKAA